MSTFDAALPRLQGALPTSQPGAAAPRPLSLWAALRWVLLGLAAGALVTVLIVVLGFAFNDAKPSSALTEAQLGELAQAAMNAGFLVFVAVIALACRRWGWRATEYFGLTRPRGHYVLLGAAALFLPLAADFAIDYFGLSLAPDEDAPQSMSSLAVTLVALAVVAPFWEELIFRGFLYRTLAATRLGVSGAILLTALLWASLHVDKTWVGMTEIFFSGLLWGWIRWRTQSIVVTLTAHYLNNLIVGVALAGLTFGWWSD